MSFTSWWDKWSFPVFMIGMVIGLFSLIAVFGIDAFVVRW